MDGNKSKAPKILSELKQGLETKGLDRCLQGTAGKCGVSGLADFVCRVGERP